MKLIRSIGRELLLLSRSYYFYIEIVMAVIYLVLLLVVIPENLSVKSTEYYYFDMPQTAYQQLESSFFPDDGSMTKESTTLKNRGSNLNVTHYGTDMKNVYVVDSEDALRALSEDSNDVGIMLSLNGTSLVYHYYLQGYETEQYKNLAMLVSSSDVMQMTELSKSQPVFPLEKDVLPLTDRQNLLSILLVVNCVLMGIFIMAAYIFEDKKSNIIHAARVTPTPISNYLILKMSAVLLTSILSAMIVTIPVMSTKANYFLLAAVILSTGFFTIASGTLLSGFFNDMESAFAAVFTVLIILLIPAIGCMIPSWNSLWLTFIPSYWAIVGVQNALMNTSAAHTFSYCGGFLLAGTGLFLLSLYHYRNKEVHGI